MRRLAGILLTASLLCFSLGGSASAGSIRAMMAEEMQASYADDEDDLGLPLFENLEPGGPGSKSKWKALGLSILFPGAGQFYTEQMKKMRIFGGAEIMVWTGFFGLRTYGAWKKEDYKAWAAYHAGADVNDKPDDYYESLTYYDNLDEYNQLELLYEGSRAVLYPDTPEYYWNWDSDGSRSHYRDLRNKSKNAYRRSLLFLGAAVINRVLSGIDAYRSAGSYNRQQEFSGSGWRVYCSSAGLTKDGDFEIGLTRQF
jgi:hypothetical protein